MLYPLRRGPQSLSGIQRFFGVMESWSNGKSEVAGPACLCVAGRQIEAGDKLRGDQPVDYYEVGRDSQVKVYLPPDSLNKNASPIFSLKQVILFIISRRHLAVFFHVLLDELPFSTVEHLVFLKREVSGRARLFKFACYGASDILNA